MMARKDRRHHGAGRHNMCATQHGYEARSCYRLLSIFAVVIRHTLLY